jgi:hypothetical protein
VFPFSFTYPYTCGWSAAQGFDESIGVDPSLFEQAMQRAHFENAMKWNDKASIATSQHDMTAAPAYRPKPQTFKS